MKLNQVCKDRIKAIREHMDDLDLQITLQLRVFENKALPQSQRDYSYKQARALINKWHRLEGTIKHIQETGRHD